MSADGGLAVAGVLRRLPWALLAPLALLLVLLLAPAYLKGAPWRHTWSLPPQDHGVKSAQAHPASSSTPAQRAPRVHAASMDTQGGNCTAAAAPQRLELPWGPPLFTDEERLRGMSYLGGGACMRAFACKLLAGGPAKVVFLGGSITAGRGAGNEAELSYVPRFARYLNATFPASAIEFVNRGEPASSSGFAAPCVDALVGSNADLVVLEYTANDNEFVGLNSLERRAYEHLLRRLLSLDSRPAVVLLHTYQWWRAAGGGMTSGLFYKEPEQQLTTLSHYYDVPSLSLRAATWRSWWDGVDGFKVDKVLKEGQHAPFEPNKSIAQAPAGEEAQYFYNDVGHPSAQGHAALAELLAALVQRSAAEAAAGLSPTARQYAQLLPPPMQPAIQEGERDACIIHDGFKAAMAAKQGFQYVAEVPDAATRDAQKWGWVARSVGDWIEFQVDTTSSNAASNATGNTTLGNTTLGTTTGNTTLHLSFLRGWMVNYGDALVSCTSGCACDDTPFSCLSDFMFTMYVLQPLQVTRHPQCRIRVTVVDAPRAQPPTEHKVHLNALFVTSY